MKKELKNKEIENLLKEVDNDQNYIMTVNCNPYNGNSEILSILGRVLNRQIRIIELLK